MWWHQSPHDPSAGSAARIRRAAHDAARRNRLASGRRRDRERAKPTGGQDQSDQPPRSAIRRELALEAFQLDDRGIELVSQRPVVSFEGLLAFAADVTESLDLALQRLEPGVKPLKIIAPKSSIVFETVQELGE